MDNLCKYSNQFLYMIEFLIILINSTIFNAFQGELLDSKESTQLKNLKERYEVDAIYVCISPYFMWFHAGYEITGEILLKLKTFLIE